MNNKTLIGLVVLILILAGIVALRGDEEVSVSEAAKVGWMGPLTGDAASYGESIKRGVELARQELGAENVELVFEDSKCDPKEAVNVVSKLINVDQVQAIIGEVCSGATLAAAPVAEEAGVVLISASSTSPKITEAGDYIFRVIPSDALQGAFGARLVYDNDFRRLAVLYSNEEYGVGFDQVLRDEFPRLGGVLVASEAFERGAADVRSQLTKIRDAGPDALYIISNSPDSAVAALRQAEELGLEVAVYGSEGLKSDGVIAGAGEAAEGLIVTAVSAGTEAFQQLHQEIYNSAPGPFAAQGHDAFQALYRVIQDGHTTSEAIKDALAEVEFDGMSGRIEFDAKGDVAGNYDVLVVREGEFVPAQ